MDGPNEDAAERLAKRRRDVILGAASSLWSLSALPYRTFRRAALRDQLAQIASDETLVSRRP